jgi:hypothetical protein
VHTMANKSEPIVQGEVITTAPIPTVTAPAPPPAVVIQSNHNAIPPPGGAPGGRWTTDKYMGVFSWGIGLCTCCCLCFMCCPCDERQVYQEPSGRKILQSGGPAGRFNEMC